MPVSLRLIRIYLSTVVRYFYYLQTFQFSSVQFIDSMPQLNDRMTEQTCRQWERTKRHQGALTIAQ